MGITDRTIQSVLAAVDIVEVVQDYVAIKKKGGYWFGLSPFKEEKTPSFSVTPSKNIFKDFSTGKGGDSVSFVMEMEGLDFPGAIRHLAKKYNIEIEEENAPVDKTQLQTKESLYIIMNYAADEYHKTLFQPEGNVGLAYFRERGFTESTIRKFKLGFAPDDWHYIDEKAKRNKFNPESLLKAGLVIEKEEGKKRYDRFRNRVMFPIHNLTGQVIAFGARTLKQAEQPKYLNSPETEIYYKGEVLFGLNLAKKAIRKLDECVLVEGYTDVISLHQSGIENAVSTSGTALTDKQVAAIRRFTKKVLLIFDGDEAGIKAAIRGLDLLLQQSMQVRVLVLPEGQDPDNFAKSRKADEIQKYFDEEALDFIAFKTKLLLKEKGGTANQEAEAIKSIINSIVQIPDPIQRAVFFKRTAEQMGVDEQMLISQGNKIILEKETKSQGRSSKAADFAPIQDQLPDGVSAPSEESTDENSIIPPNFFAEREFVRLLINHGHEDVETEDGDTHKVANLLMEHMGDLKFKTPIFKELKKIYFEYLEANKLKTGYELTTHPDSNIKSEVVDLITQRFQISDQWMDRFKIFVPEHDNPIGTVVHRSILWLKFRHLKALSQEIIELIKASETDEEIEENQRLYMSLKEETIEVARLIGNVIL
jgi:DNA primase